MDDDAQVPDQIDTGITPLDEDLPERLRVHSLARVLGTTSRRVLDALAELDGRTRSPHSSVDRSDAVRVRDVLSADRESGEPAAVEVVVLGDVDGRGDDLVPDLGPADEPESRLLLETPDLPAAQEGADERVNQADYLPLFVAPQPVTESDRDRPARRTAPAAADDGTDGDRGDDDSDDDGDDDQAERPANRRRRRGRRGRGRRRGGDGEPGDGDGGDDENAESDDDTESNASDDDGDNGDDDGAGGDGPTRRRRRRRRRKSGASGEDGDAASPDDPPNTVVHERPPRSRSDKSDSDRANGEIQGISGSTRLEAKRQRRRDGRDAGRRRPPILSEAEFLARREAVERVMVVRDKVRTEPPHEGARYTQIAVLEDGVVVEHFVTSAGSASLVGNIYLGIVQNVLPSMEAAFVDIGRGRNGVLYAGEVNWEAAGLGGAQRKIEQALKPGDYVVVQVSKDPVGHKGARLTTQVSLAGRYLVYVPGASSTGISRKLPDTERQRLKEILREVVPADAGVIIRTASEGVKEDDIRIDVTRLQERWNEVETKAREIKEKAAGAAIALYEEPDVLVKVIRDLFNEDFSGLIVSGDNAWGTINDYVNSVAPELMPKLTKYETAHAGGQIAAPDVFAVHRIEEQLAKAMDRKVWLPSGGTLVIDRTEAMTVVDVNTGKFTGAGGNLEQTVTKNNLEAAEEIVRQLRLRDIGGIIVIDFIDMVLESNRDLVLRRLTEALGRDRTRHQVSEVTSLGLIQLTRKKLGTGLVEAFSTTCPHCAGRGIMLHTDPVDSAPAQARKSEAGVSRRGKRARKVKPEEVVPPRLPSHAHGEHPMFKAMAAGKHGDDEHDGAVDPDLVDGDAAPAAPGDEIAEESAQTAEQVAEEVAEADLEDEDFDDEDEDDEDDDDDDDDDDIDVDLDADDEDEDEDDDDIDVVDSDDEDADDEDEDDEDSDDEDDEDDEDEDDEDDEDDVEDSREVELVPTAAVGRPRRRRAAARPAGPPSLDR